MGAYLDLAAGNAALKEWYDGQKVENLAYSKNPLLAMIPKEPNATGKVVPIPVIYEVSQGRSPIFAFAQSNQTPVQLAEFFLTLRPDYSIATLAQQAMLASDDDKGGFLKFSRLYVDIAIQSAALSAASAMFRDGLGTIGTISTIGTVGTGVIQLTNIADVSQFGINQTLQFATVNGGVPVAALGYVVSRNVQLGQITVSATALGGAAGNPVGWAANGVLLVQGDSNAKMSGAAGWLPATAPLATDNWYGVNRSPDSRLYGIQYNGAQQAIEEALVDHAMLLAREKGDPRHFFTNYGSLSALVKAMGSRREYVDWEGDGEIGFRGAKVQGPNGAIECYADRNCQAATGFLMQLETWKLYSLNPVPFIFKYGDGLEMLRLANGDAMEVRAGYYANIGCRAPGWSGQTTLAT